MDYTVSVLEYIGRYRYTMSLNHEYPCRRPYQSGTSIYFDFNKADMTRILARDKLRIDLDADFGLLPILHNPAIAKHLVVLPNWIITDAILDELVQTNVKRLMFQECTWNATRIHRFDGAVYEATQQILTNFWPTKTDNDGPIHTLPPTVRSLKIQYDEDLQCSLDHLESLSAFDIPYNFRGTVKKPVRFNSGYDDPDLVIRCLEQYAILNDDYVMEALFVLQWLMSLQRR